MAETRKLAAILAADVVGYSRLTATDEERTIARLRGLRTDLIDPAISVYHGRVVKRTGDGILIEFRSIVDAVRCAIEVQTGMVERNAGIPPERQIQFRVGIHLGDVVEESDGDLMGDGVNIAARLEGIAEPGAVCLSNAAYEQVRDKIEASFADLGEQELKNIARPLRIFSLSGAGAPQRETQRISPLPPAGGRSLAGGLAAARIPPRLSIVVLPFANLGGDVEQEYFVDGVTESLTTDLSRISGSFVIARNTAFTYRGKPVDVKQIGRELNVRYVLEGSLQKGGNRIRVNVQLIDTETGNHLWAERFDKPVADLFDMQDEIVARIANQLGTQLAEAEARRSERSPHPDSMDLYFQGLSRTNKGWAPEYLREARDFFERALALDPGNVSALVGTADVDMIVGGGALTDDREARLAAAEASATRALSLAPNHVFAYYVLGSVHILTGHAAQGVAENEHALALDRNFAVAHANIGLGKISLGRAEETEAHILEALRLSPRDRMSFIWMAVAGSAKLCLGRDEEAFAWLRRSIDANRNYPLAHFRLAAALAQLDKMDEARAAVAAGLALDPTFTISRRLGVASDNPTYLVQRERIIDGMRKAGVPAE